MLNKEKNLKCQNQIYAIIDKETELVVNTMICTNEKEARKNMKQALKNIEKMGVDMNEYELIELDLYRKIEIETVEETLKRIDKEINKEINE